MNGVAAAAAVSAWVGALAGWFDAIPIGPAVAIGVGLLIGLPRGRRLAAVLIVVAVAGALSGGAARQRRDATLATAVAPGPVTVVGRVADQPEVRRGTSRFVLADPVSPDGPLGAPVGVETAGPAPDAGTRVVVEGWVDGRAAFIRGDPVAAVVRRAEIVAADPGAPLVAVGNALRHRVHDQLARGKATPARALLAGFLIGDTSGLDDLDVDALRRAGLSHFVAVSGSNVALFLAAWWLLVTPFGGPRVRAALGVVGVMVFIVVTRWEPSVVRAGVMISLILVGRMVDLVVSPFIALCVTVTSVLLVAGDLAVSVGFQLSVAATAGVMLGASRGARRRPRWLWATLTATVAAQVAVLPLLLVHFGAVPMAAPITNAAAAPLVTAATSLAGIGVLAGLAPVVELATVVADAVLTLARAAAAWPQLGPGGVAGAAVLTAAGRIRRTRPAVIAGVVAAVVIALMPAPAPTGATVTFLDVGQGDAVVVRDGGVTMLVDGGPDPRVLGDALARNGVRHIDLLVVTHGDIDHVGGLDGIVDRMRPDELWVPDQPHLGEALEALVVDAAAAGVPVRGIRSGARTSVGRLDVASVGPRRRYLADNDGSVVLRVDAPGASVLLPGDIEAIAQAELPPLRPTVLLVPHHGSATSDLRWLAATAGEVAVISAGENDYGHPAPAVVATLHEAGSRVLTTREDGDVTVRLAS